jgi:hypothetical protein
MEMMAYVCGIDEYAAIIQDVRDACFGADDSVSGEAGEACADARGVRDGGDRLAGGGSRNCRVEREPAGGTAGAGADLVPGSARIAGSCVKWRRENG